MSRVNQKGSILLAVLFFSSIVLAVFAAFHSQVADSLKLRLTEPTEYPAEGIDRIRAWKTPNASDTYSIVSLQESSGAYEFMAASGSEVVFKRTASGTVTVTLLDGAPIKLMTNDAGSYTGWAVFTAKSWSLSDGSGDLRFSTLGGYSRGKISGNVLPEEETYRIKMIYGNTTVPTNTFQIKR